MGFLVVNKYKSCHFVFPPELVVKLSVRFYSSPIWTIHSIGTTQSLF